MIELPRWAKLADFNGTLIDAGFTQRGLQSLDRIDRKGSRHKIALTSIPLRGDQGRIMISQLLRGKQEGLRVALPLLTPQGEPGAVVLAAAVATGRTLSVTGGTPGYLCKEGYWLSVEDADGRHYLHSVSAPARFDAAGAASLTLDVMIRAELPAGARVHLARPMVEGLVEGEEWEWTFAVQRVVGLEFAIEEAR